MLSMRNIVAGYKDFQPGSINVRLDAVYMLNSTLNMVLAKDGKM